MSIFRLPYNNITQAASYYSEDLRDHFTNDLLNLVAHVRSYFRLLSNCLLRDISCIFFIQFITFVFDQSRAIFVLIYHMLHGVT